MDVFNTLDFVDFENVLRTRGWATAAFKRLRIQCS
jgi:hypothetical protein